MIVVCDVTVSTWPPWLSLRSVTSSWVWRSPPRPPSASRSLRLRSRPKSSHSWLPPPPSPSTSTVTRSSPPPPATTRRRPSHRRRSGGWEPSQPPTFTYVPTISTCHQTTSRRQATPTFCPRTCWRSSSSSLTCVLRSVAAGNVTIVCYLVGQEGTTWTWTAKDRGSWRALAEGCFLLWKDVP